jgi:hypothetical protein
MPTRLQLEKWMNHTFTHLGWMVLAANRGERAKLRAYLENIDQLLDALDAKRAQVRDPDERDDLDILAGEVHLLKSFTEQSFGRPMQQGGRR